MIYCISDIHGEADRFHDMLKLINFSPDDTLYIIGDVIDRKPDGVEILQEIMATPNMIMLLGNHEDMCLKTLGQKSEFGARQLWTSNGGNSTYRELVYHTTDINRKQILKYLSSLPTFIDLEVNQQKFHLVHGWPSKLIEDQIWGRPNDGLGFYWPEDTIAIVGHTPTIYLDRENKEAPFRILHKESALHNRKYIMIDCGCGNKTERRRLACLRLDDMKEFYV